MNNVNDLIPFVVLFILQIKKKEKNTMDML